MSLAIQVVDNDIDNVLNTWLNEYCKNNKMPAELEKMFRRCFVNTLQTTTQILDDGTTYVFTGDIPAMWLRDSSAQVSPYLSLVKTNPQIRDIIKGLLKRQFMYINIDPYANAFNIAANGKGHKDITKQSDWIWERKYEIDSLCYPIWLAYRFYELTGDKSIFDVGFLQAADAVIKVFRTEQHHCEKSDYSFIRHGVYSYDTLDNDGRGGNHAYTGMTWSAFRPSDDRCEYGYLIPSNQFAVVILRYLNEIYSLLNMPVKAAAASELEKQIEDGIKRYGIVNHEKFGKIYAYETDGYGNYNLMDDANVPSLLSLPYLGYCSESDEIYKNTRAFILSNNNPYYFSGTFASGIGSPHTPKDYIWHIGLIMQGITSNNQEERDMILNTLLKTHDNTFYMHEGFDKNNPSNYTRPWFAWANSIFSVFIMKYNELKKN